MSAIILYVHIYISQNELGWIRNQQPKLSKTHSSVWTEVIFLYAKLDDRDVIVNKKRYNSMFVLQTMITVKIIRGLYNNDIFHVRNINHYAYT